MNTPQEVVAFYVNRIENAKHPVEKCIIKDDLMLYYYRLTDDECQAVDVAMRPYLDEVHAKLVKEDPLLQRAEELLNRIRSRVPQS